jgi:2-alkyl-3-oxoalkanoate reductase
MRVFVAGASGAIGEPLIVELLARGHSVLGMTSSETRANILEGQGAETVIVTRSTHLHWKLPFGNQKQKR